jgi:hypothetical protein
MEESRGKAGALERKGWDWGLFWERVSVSLVKGLPLPGGFWLGSCKQSKFYCLAFSFLQGTQGLKRNRKLGRVRRGGNNSSQQPR